MCGGDWSEHNSATGGYYRCNRYVPQAEAGDAGGSGSAPWAFIGDFFGKIQVMGRWYGEPNMGLHFIAGGCIGCVQS